MNSKIAVIGCGWLGFPLAKTLVNEGYTVHGTTTSPAKLKNLQRSGIVPFLIEITSEGIIGDLNSCLLECDTVIVNIPPGLRKNPEHNYVQHMSYLIEVIEASSTRQVLFISSTSVYDDAENFPLITEASITTKSQRGQQLLKVEKRFQNNTNFRSTVLRFSGLFGEDRHPATFLSGRTGLKNALAPVNLIHRDDCIGTIICIIQKNIWNTVLNASTTANPTKLAYYTSVCKTLGIAIPKFDTHSPSKGKIVDATALKQTLDYEFKITIPSY